MYARTKILIKCINVVVSFFKKKTAVEHKMLLVSNVLSLLFK